MLDFRIETFLTVCNHMNFTRAAEELHITQPAVSQHIQYLEQQYHVQLFRHVGKKTILTEAGEKLRNAVTTIKNDEKVLVKQMRQANPEKTAMVFGVTMTVGEYIIAPLISKYLRRHPDIDVHIKRGNTSQLLSALHAGEIDFAFVEGYLDPGEYDLLPYRTEKFIAVCNSNHSFTNGRIPKTLSDLLTERLIVREQGSGTRDILEKNLAVHDLRISDFAHLAEVESMHTIVSLLLEDCGISFLYEIAVMNELAEGRLREIALDDFHMTHGMSFVWNKGSVFGDTYRHICQELANLTT